MFVAGEGAFAQLLPERRLVRKGNSDYEKGDYLESEIDYLRAREKNPLMFEAGFNLGNTYYKQGRFEEAAELYSKPAPAGITQQGAARSYYNAGNAQFQQRKLQEALESYKQSLRIDPDDLEAKFNLAYVKKLLEEQEKDQDDDQDRQDDDQQKPDNQKDRQDRNDKKDKDDDDQDDPEPPDENSGDGDEQSPENDGSNDPDDNPNDPSGSQNPQDNEGQSDKEEENEGDDKEDDQQNSGGGQDERDNDEKNQQYDPQQGQSGMTRQEAEQMLEAINRSDEKTREKVDEQKGRAIGGSNKNW